MCRSANSALTATSAVPVLQQLPALIADTSCLQAARETAPCIISIYFFLISDIVNKNTMAPMAVPSDGIPLGVPMSAHDLTDTARNGFYSIGANPPPAWSSCT